MNTTLDAYISLCAAFNVLNATGSLGSCAAVEWRTDLSIVLGSWQVIALGILMQTRGTGCLRVSTDAKQLMQHSFLGGADVGLEIGVFCTTL